MRSIACAGTLALAGACDGSAAGFVATNPCARPLQRRIAVESTAANALQPSINRLPLPACRRRTRLASTSVAAGVLAVSSSCGMLVERTVSNGGHVVTLLTAALLSNGASVIPVDHFLYDMCWSTFLPASLVFALLSSSAPAPAGISDQMEEVSKSNAVRATILAMALPFVAGSLGSILGCIASYSFVVMPYAKHVTALLAGCLCASYIGGTVNFFATAKVLRDVAGGDAGVGSAFGSLAAADLVVMAAYFALLSAASRSKWLHRLFPSKWGGKGDERESKVAAEQQSSSIGTAEGSGRWVTLTAAAVASTIALASVFVATRLERTIANPPGTMCAFLAIFGLTFQRLISLGLSNGSTSSAFALHATKCLRRIPEIAPIMSNVCFYLLFAAVGATADLSSAIAGGPAALIFASLALMVHSLTVVAGALCWPSSSWEEVLTASNAAIGGPSTAAAFAAGLVPESKKATGNGTDRGSYRSALVIGATFWGVLGYAVATGIGVSVSRILLRGR
ncbi:hypothetical protein ACHAXT_012060 [Thalassiosira profunda]